MIMKRGRFSYILFLLDSTYMCAESAMASCCCCPALPAPEYQNVLLPRAAVAGLRSEPYLCLICIALILNSFMIVVSRLKYTGLTTCRLALPSVLLSTYPRQNDRLDPALPVRPRDPRPWPPLHSAIFPAPVFPSRSAFPPRPVVSTYGA